MIAAGTIYYMVQICTDKCTDKCCSTDKCLETQDTTYSSSFGTTTIVGQSLRVLRSGLGFPS